MRMQRVNKVRINNCDCVYLYVYVCMYGWMDVHIEHKQATSPSITSCADRSLVSVVSACLRACVSTACVDVTAAALTAPDAALAEGVETALWCEDASYSKAKKNVQFAPLINPKWIVQTEENKEVCCNCYAGCSFVCFSKFDFGVWLMMVKLKMKIVRTLY